MSAVGPVVAFWVRRLHGSLSGAAGLTYSFEH